VTPHRNMKYLDFCWGGGCLRSQWACLGEWAVAFMCAFSWKLTVTLNAVWCLRGWGKTVGKSMKNTEV
jgi:hypothetical protein